MSNNEWETPDDFFNHLHSIYNFDVDAAANELNHKLPVWFGSGSPVGVEDALTAKWRDYGEYFWLNPPYGRGYLEKFLKKANEEWVNGCSIVLLLPVDTSTHWWHTWVKPFDVEFIQGRIKFKGATGSPRFANCIVRMMND